MRIRVATVDDLDVLVRHRRAMFEAFGEKDAASLARHDVVYRRWARRLMKRGEFAGFIADAKQTVVASGCIWLQERQPRPGFDGGGLPYLLSMFTEPAWRGRGLARRIVQAAIAWSRKKGFKVMTLHASKMGRGVYADLGFERIWEMKKRLNYGRARDRTRSSGSRQR